MKLASVQIKNFRTIKNQTIGFSDYTCFVGPNGAGKSTVLIALCVLFRYSTDAVTNLLVLEEEDFHQKNIDEPIEITATFVDLTGDAQKQLAHYYRQGTLVFSAVAKWDKNTRSAPVVQYGKREVMQAFTQFFKEDENKAKIEDLRKLYASYKEKFSSLPSASSKLEMITALRQYEESHPAECILVDSEDEFYGGAGKSKNLLDQFVQWVFVPAVKDATTEQFETKKTALGQILERTVRSKMSLTAPLEKLREEAYAKYNEILLQHEKSLDELAHSLTDRVRQWAHPDSRIRLSWKNEESQVSIADPVAKVLAGEGSFEGHLPRFGHGFQRSFLLALLQELVSTGSGNEPTLILACEEPELYQHPPQVRHLASIVDELTSKDTQVLVCTHSPLFIRGENFEEIRFVTKTRDKGDAIISQLTFDQLAERIKNAGGEPPQKMEGTALKVSQSLKPQTNEMFFTSILILVEGIEDVAYVTTQLVLQGCWNEFRRHGGHIVYCEGKSKMIVLLAIARGLNIPTFVVFDADTSKCQGEHSHKTEHERDNGILMTLAGGVGHPLPTDTIWQDVMVVWKDCIGSTLSDEFGKEKWDRIRNDEKKRQGVIDVSDIFKSSSYIQGLLSHLWDQNTKSKTLERLCTAILEFAKNLGDSEERRAN